MVSVVVLAYNEASRISYCLDSLSEFSEVIVLDMYSTDDTCQIAENFGAKVIKVPAREKFDILREEGIKVAKYDWILFMMQMNWSLSYYVIIYIIQLNQIVK